MKRYAAHYVIVPPDRVLKQHYVELDDEDNLKEVAPLTEEIAGTVFYNGILVLSSKKIDRNTLITIQGKEDYMCRIEFLLQSDWIVFEPGKPVFVYQL